jgi:ADP-ribose pyrophosphatase YjhB (NUDIX family)
MMEGAARMSMVSFARDGVRFHFRVVGVCVNAGHVLLCRAGTTDHWFMPGGRVELGETAEDALRREMREELDAHVAVGRLLWVVENHYTLVGERTHLLELMFAMELPAASPLLALDHERHTTDSGVSLTIRWHALDALERVVLKPNFLPAALRALPEQPRHVVHIEP